MVGLHREFAIVEVEFTWANRQSFASVIRIVSEAVVKNNVAIVKRCGKGTESCAQAEAKSNDPKTSA